MGNHIEVCKYLLSNGASIDIRDGEEVSSFPSLCRPSGMSLPCSTVSVYVYMCECKCVVDAFMYMNVHVYICMLSLQHMNIIQ